MTINLLVTTLDDLSTRAQNIINSFDNYNDALIHYNKFETFINCRNCGEHTNRELISFFEYNIKYNINKSK